LPVAWKALLRLEALGVLAHEVAHHHDHTERVARGRWMAEEDEPVERYAEAMQHRWTQSVVLPYLRERYAAEVAETERWVARHGGAALPFESLADDPRMTGRGGLVHSERLWTMCEALERLAGEVERGEPEWACHTCFARWLYYQARYDDALAVVGGVLEARPDEPRALLLKGDVLARQGRHAEALAIGRALAARDPRDDEAWQIVADACQKLGLWREAEAALAVRLELAAAEGGPAHRLLLQRAEVRIGSGDLAGAARDLDAVESDRPYVLRRVAQLRARIEAAANAASDGETAIKSTADAS
ncbi:MAG: tetratricopeptide repeat protein, partial [Longimicrobiaceae bacterium]